MPKKRVVASSDGNFSPVNRRTASFVRRARHLRGEIGDELNNLAVQLSDTSSTLDQTASLVVDVHSYLLGKQLCDQA